MNTEVKTKEKKVTAKRVRKPLHKRRVLDAPVREGFHRRWVNEGVGAVEAYEEAGYKVVLERDLYPDTKRTQDASQMGTVVRRVVNKQHSENAQTAILMEIPMEFYLEDKKEIHKNLDEIENSIDPSAVKNRDGFYGD